MVWALKAILRNTSGRDAADRAGPKVFTKRERRHKRSRTAMVKSALELSHNARNEEMEL
jgi:hypothetical protein